MSANQEIPAISPKEQLRLARENKDGSKEIVVVHKGKGHAANRKVMNATKTEVDEIVFDSKLEAYMYGLLKNLGIEFERQKVYEIIPKFVYHGRIVRPMEIIPDFYIPEFNLIIDPKGFCTDVDRVKIKIFKKFLYDKDPDNIPSILWPKTQKECDAVANAILQLKEQSSQR